MAVKKTVIVPRVKETHANGRMRVDIPEFSLTLPDEKTIGATAAKIIERRLKERLGAVPSKWKGLARWLSNNIKTSGDTVTWPHSDAVERMGAMKLDPKWLDEAIKEIVGKAFDGNRSASRSTQYHLSARTAFADEYRHSSRVLGSRSPADESGGR
jgi:hypothetical protein